MFPEAGRAHWGDHVLTGRGEFSDGDIAATGARASEGGSLPSLTSDLAP
jgi:hypothetical protein